VGTSAQEEVADPMRLSRKVLSRRELLQHGGRATGGMLAVAAFGPLVRHPGAATDGAPTASSPGSADPAVGPATPRTRLTDAAQRLLQDTSPQFLIDHCHRSVELAMLIVGAGSIGGGAGRRDPAPRSRPNFPISLLGGPVRGGQR
jgi:hypothetical protein